MKKKKSKELFTAVCIIENVSNDGIKKYLLFQRPKTGNYNSILNWTITRVLFYSFGFRNVVI
jgi:hypothetical protein